MAEEKIARFKKKCVMYKCSNYFIIGPGYNTMSNNYCKKHRTYL
jgi:hypothetical protein